MSVTFVPADEEELEAFMGAFYIKALIIDEMAASPDAKIRAMMPKLRAVKGWTVDQLFEILCEMKGTDPATQLGLKK